MSLMCIIQLHIPESRTSSINSVANLVLLPFKGFWFSKALFAVRVMSLGSPQAHVHFLPPPLMYDLYIEEFRLSNRINVIRQNNKL